jgi:hypothetical protein
MPKSPPSLPSRVGNEHGFGVVVCTNNDLLNPDVASEIAHRALGGKIEPMRRAIHLEYNYREGG